MAGLDPAQVLAVSHGGGAALVFAGAGSGKTRVITHRIARLLADGVTPERILAVTFTNRAADEMRSRLMNMAPPGQVKRLWVGTFHGQCARILRMYADAVDRRKDFTIYDDDDQQAVIRQIVQELQLDKKIWATKLIAERIEKAKRKAQSPHDLATVEDNSDVATFVKIWDRYEQWLRASNAVDFADLILLTVRLGESATDEGATLRSMFDYMLVDEMQDTDECQLRLIRVFGASSNVFAVGDDDQSIYAWRGADYKNIARFRDEVFDGVAVYKLEQNYRSTKNIVRAAAGVISRNVEREPKELTTGNVPGSRVAVVACATDRDEAAFVVGRIRMLIGTGVQPSDIAVLYRKHAQSRAIEDQLRDWAVPYRIIRGHRFYDRREVKDVLAHLRLLANSASNVDFMRAADSPPRGIGPTTLKRLSEIAGARKCSFWDAIPVAAEAPEIRRKERSNLFAFQRNMAAFAATLDQERPSEFAARLIAAIGYKEWLFGEAKRAIEDGRLADAGEVDERVRNVDELVNAIAAYEARAAERGDVSTMRGYLEAVALIEEDDDKGVERVSLLTIHAAKGLEWYSVFLVGAEENLLPMPAPVEPGQVGNLANSAGPAEDRRLAYVAMTRAQHRLFVTHAAMRFVRGVAEHRSPSRYIGDMPADCIAVMSAAEYADLEREAIARAG